MPSFVTTVVCRLIVLLLLRDVPTPLIRATATNDAITIVNELIHINILIFIIITTTIVIYSATATNDAATKLPVELLKIL